MTRPVEAPERSGTGERVVYVAPVDGGEWGDDFDLVELCAVVRRGKWFVALLTLAATVLGVAYALLTPEWYRAEAVLVPTETAHLQDLATQFGGLASLAGVALETNENAEPLAVLRSKGFVRDFLRDTELVDLVLAAKRNPVKGIQLGGNGEADAREAVDYFMARVLDVVQDRKTGIVTVRVEWRNPRQAADWANRLVERLNQRMRTRALQEANANIAYLRSELPTTAALALQNSIARLLELEMQKAMVARGNREFSYRVVDEATAPRKRVWPKRSLIVILSGLLGFGLAVGTVVLRQSLKPLSGV